MKQLIVFFLLLRMIIIPFSITKEPETEHSEVPAAILQQLQEQFPAGKYWNHIGSRYNNPDGWTDTACWHHSSGICSAYGYSGACGCNSYGGAIQCHGFAMKLTDLYAGSMLKTWEKAYDLDNLKAGDAIRYRNDRHTIWVTAVDGNVVTFADCNRGGPCKIRWGKINYKEDIMKTLTCVYVSPSPPETPELRCEGEYRIGKPITLSWDAVEYAEEYYLTIYLEDRLLQHLSLDGDTSYDFTPQENGTYHFLLTAGNYVGSSETVDTTVMITPYYGLACGPSSLGWIQDAVTFTADREVIPTAWSNESALT